MMPITEESIQEHLQALTTRSEDRQKLRDLIDQMDAAENAKEPATPKMASVPAHLAAFAKAMKLPA